MININGLIKKINMMPNCKEKALQICLFYSYISFLLESKQINNDDVAYLINQINENETFLKHFIHDEKQAVNNLLMATDKLTDLYENVLNYATNFNLFTVPLPHMNTKNLLMYAQDFFKYIDSNAYDLFNYLIDNDLVYESDLANYGGKCFKLDGKNSAIILKYDTIPFYKIFALVHEMGHAYYHYLGKANPSLMRTNLANECMPRIFEQLFLVYLKENYLLDKNTIDIYERFFLMHQLDITNSTYIVNKLLLNGNISPLFYLESIRADITFDQYFDMSIIKANKPDYQEFLSFNNNYYSYAFLLSMVIREKFKIDENNTKKFIKNLPYYARELSSSELINLFKKSDYTNATNKNTTRILAKTHYKKNGI